MGLISSSGPSGGLLSDYSHTTQKTNYLSSRAWGVLSALWRNLKSSRSPKRGIKSP